MNIPDEQAAGDPLAALLVDIEAYGEHLDAVIARRRARRAAGLLPGDRRVVHHIDGDPANNDLDNLRVVDPRENGAGQ